MVSVAGWVIVRCAQGSFTARNAKTPATVAAIPAHSIHMSGPNARREFGIARCVDGSESGEVWRALDHASRGGADPNGAAAVLSCAVTGADGGLAPRGGGGGGSERRSGRLELRRDGRRWRARHRRGDGLGARRRTLPAGRAR